MSSDHTDIEHDLHAAEYPPQPDAPRPPVPRPPATSLAGIEGWAQAEAAHAARLAVVAGRLGALGERLAFRGGARRLVLLEATELGWHGGLRVAPDRLALWLALRLSGAAADIAALGRLAWAVQRLEGGPGPEIGPETGPESSGLAAFLGRHERAGGDALGADWRALLARARALHPLTRACMGFHLWSLAGLDRGGPLEAAVTAARIAAEGTPGLPFAPLGLGGAVPFGPGGSPEARLGRWLEGLHAAALAALRHLERLAAWQDRAEAAMRPLSGRTPPRLRALLAEWPLLSTPMAQGLAGSSYAATRRALLWMQARGLAEEVTGQSRFRMWRAAL